MLRHLGHAPDRGKLLRFLCACGRRLHHLMTDPRSRKAIEVAERSALSPVADEELFAAYDEAEQAVDEAPGESNDSPGVRAAGFAFDTLHFIMNKGDAYSAADLVESAAIAVAEARGPEARRAALALERAAQAKLLREIYGNPFRG
jgi:hypothetical protein